MTFQKWLDEGRLRPHRSSAKEIAELLRVVDRDIADAGLLALSPDRRFTTAYNAALQLSTISLRASGYRTSGAAHHWITFQVLPEIMGESQSERADYFDHCRAKRNLADYDQAGGISEADVDELLDEVTRLRIDVLDWLAQNHADLTRHS